MLKDYKADLTKQLDMLTSSSNDTDDLSKLKLKSLILDLIHHIEIIDDLIKNNVKDIKRWDWYKLLKFLFNTKVNLCKI